MKKQVNKQNQIASGNIFSKGPGKIGLDATSGELGENGSKAQDEIFLFCSVSRNKMLV